MLAALLPDHRQKVLDVMEIFPGLTPGKAVEVLGKGWASKLSEFLARREADVPAM